MLFEMEACQFLLCGVLSAPAASCCYNQNLNLYTSNTLNFVTELCFVTVLMKIYIFLSCTLICKELALLACSLTIVYPGLIPSHTCTSLDSSVSDVQGNAALDVFFIMNHELWSCCLNGVGAKLTDGSWTLALAGQESEYDTKPGPSL